MISNIKIRLRFHVAVAALALALGWISAPLSLVFWEPDVCEMECCIAKGHCCCATRRAYVKGHEPKPGDISLTIETTLTNRCPAGCAASGISAKNNLTRAEHAPLVTPTSAPLPHCWDRFQLDHQFSAQPSSPRAPPARDGLIA